MKRRRSGGRAAPGAVAGARHREDDKLKEAHFGKPADMGAGPRKRRSRWGGDSGRVLREGGTWRSRGWRDGSRPEACATAGRDVEGAARPAHLRARVRDLVLGRAVSRCWMDGCIDSLLDRAGRHTRRNAFTFTDSGCALTAKDAGSTVSAPRLERRPARRVVRRRSAHRCGG
jgi:hypothetical protein